MPALVEGYEYDVFISYRQNDNKYDGWVTTFVENLQKELEATIKGTISVYFDENPHDGLLETHQVDESLSSKLKCLVFIPVVSQTYCDPDCFAWQQEFLAFKKIASEDKLGMLITLPNGNVVGRVLPIMIHKIDDSDRQFLEEELNGPVRSVDFIYEAPGVNRPLDEKHDDTYREKNKPIYRDQINKVANGIKEIVIGIKNIDHIRSKQTRKHAKLSGMSIKAEDKFSIRLSLNSLLRRNIPQVLLVLGILGIIIYKSILSLVKMDFIPSWAIPLSVVAMIVIGVGALFMAWFYEFTPEGLTGTASWQSRLNPFPGYKRKPFTGMVTIIGLLLILMGQTFYTEISDYFERLSPRYIREKSIVVLPFKNLDGEENYLSAGLTLDLTTQLSKISAVKVISSASAKLYDSEDVDLDKMSDELKVTSVLKGAIQQVGTLLKITCELIDTESQHIIWADSFNRSINDLITVQSDLSQLIAEQLEAKLTEKEKARIEKAPTKDITAYDHYLKGRDYYYKYQKDFNDSAVVEFKSAIRLDSTYALAWAGLGDAYSQMNVLFGMDKSWNDSSISAGTHAIALDPDSEVAYKALANAYSYALKYNKAFELVQKAVEINPNYPPAVGNLGSMYFSRGDLFQALKWQVKGAQLNPRSFIPPLMNGWTFRLLGDMENARLWLEKSLALKPYADTYRELGYTLVLQGKKPEAIALVPKILSLGQGNARLFREAGLITLFANQQDSAKRYFQRALELEPQLANDPNSIVPLANAYFEITSGNEQEGKEHIQGLNEQYLDLINSGSEDDDQRIYMASVMIMQGDQQSAIKWIKRAIDTHWNDYAMINHIPWFLGTKDDPDYQAFIAPVKSKLNTIREQAQTIPGANLK